MVIGKKRGQITLFVIIALIIIGLAILFYLFYPKIKSFAGFSSENPSDILDRCIREDLEKAIEKVSLQGGSLNPEHYYLFNGSKLDYLCYSSEYYKTCVVQKPLLLREVEKELKKALDKKARQCVSELKEKYTKKGYSVKIENESFNLLIYPGKIILSFGDKLTLKKNEETKRYNKIDVIINNNLYELLDVATDIIKWETQLGDSESTYEMSKYRGIKVEKKKQEDGTTVYILTHRESGDKFQFASRSLAWPPGYGATLY